MSRSECTILGCPVRPQARDSATGRHRVVWGDCRHDFVNDKQVGRLIPACVIDFPLGELHGLQGDADNALDLDASLVAVKEDE